MPCKLFRIRFKALYWLNGEKSYFLRKYTNSSLIVPTLKHGGTRALSRKKPIYSRAVDALMEWDVGCFDFVATANEKWIIQSVSPHSAVGVVTIAP